MNWNNSFYYAMESYKAMMKSMNCCTSPKTYGIMIQGRRKKKKNK